MKLILPAIICLAFSCPPFHSKAQENSSKTLLWRISGNGLQKPSYLYGTMHLKDKRLFFFGDSVYKSIEASEGFAMELDPNEMMDSLFSKMSEADTSTLLRKLLDEKKFKSVAKKLEKKFGMPAEKISRKQLVAERENWYYKIRKSDDMKAVVDLYLYDLARKQGKWVGGIEDINDQLGIKDELGKDININDYIEDDEDVKRTSYLEKMISLYTDADIDKIDRFFVGSQSQKTMDLLLVNRNIKMAARMDSLAHIRNSFFAVGVAHLPGETGLIHLLQGKGFYVTPVFSSKKIAPGKYTYNAKEIPWIKISEQDSAYSVEMPGKASDLKLMGDELKFKVYADLVSGNTYMSGFSFISTDEKQEALAGRMMKSFSAKGFEKKDERKISNRGINGTEIVAILGKIYFRIQIFSIANKVFIVMAGNEKKDGLNSGEVERFFLSFTMNTMLLAKPNKWVNYTDELKAFDISFPRKPGLDKLKPAETAKYVETTTYTALDIPNNTYYLVVVNQTKKGFVMNDDSTVFSNKIKFYKQKNAVISDTRKFDYEGNAAMSFSALTNRDGLDFVAKILIISRGNRDYTIAAVTQKGKEDYPDITRFFRSFKLMPYKESVWTKKPAPDNVFSTWAPSVFEQLLRDTAGLTAEEIKYELIESRKLIQFISHEPNSAISYTVNIHPVSKYYWAKDDSSFLADQSRPYFLNLGSDDAIANPGKFDSLVYKRVIANGKINGIEILVKDAGGPYFKRVRILPHGDSSYHLLVYAPYSIITNENNNKFFEDFRFSNEDLPSVKLKNKTDVILSDLAGTDSTARSDALEVMAEAKFDPADLPLLYQAYLKKYPEDKTVYTTVNQKISDAINRVHDSSTVSFVKDNYISGTINLPELRNGMLEMLASQQTRSATEAAKELLLKAPPTIGMPNYFINKLSDSLLLSALIFPEAARFFGDSILGPGMLRLASELIDSNILQKDILMNNLEGIMHTANEQLVKLKKDQEAYPYYNYYIIDVLEKINSKQSIGLLNAFMKTAADPFIKKYAVLALLRMKQSVSPLHLSKVAADKDYRVSFYKQLKKIGKQELFPPEFLTQQKFAEGYIYKYGLEDDMDNTGCKLVGERVASIKGVQRRFYLYEVSFDYEEDRESHLAICGRFDMNRKNVELNDDDQVVKIFYDEKYDAAAIDKLYNEFITGENVGAGFTPVP